MTALKQRLAKVEATRNVKAAKAALSFIWASPDDDAALEAAVKLAEDEGCLIFVNSIYPPYQPGEDPGIETGLQRRG